MQNQTNIIMSTFYLNNLMRKLWTQHVMWSRSFIISTLNSEGSQQSVTNRLLRNPLDFGNVLSKYYEKDIVDEFTQLLTEHLTIAAEYVDSIKNYDSDLLQVNREKWFVNANNLARFFARINPYWNYDRWRKLLYNHLYMLELEVAHQINHEYEEAIKNYDMMEKEALAMADYMTKGIITQFPQK